MGSTGWKYTVPHQADMNKVLNDLRQEVFTRGDYERPRISIDFLDEMNFFGVNEPLRETLIKQYGLGALRKPLAEVGIGRFRDWIIALSKADAIQTMEELEVLRMLSPSGTSSILDITVIHPESREYGLYPLAPDTVARLFGSSQPTRETIQKWVNRVVSRDETRLYDRGEGFFVIIYRDGKPDAIYIEGCSGD